MPGFFKRFHRDKARANTEKQSGQQSATGQEARPLSAGLFHRRSHKVRPAADSNGAPVESSIVLAVAPSLDIRFPLERTPSPTLVQVDESQSPWVDVGEVSAGQHVAGTSLGLAGLSWQQRPVNPRLKAILARARLNAHQTTTLIIACARVLGEQGLSTLGLFRPWRIAESPFLITHTLGLFLQAVDPDGAAIPLADKDLLAIGRDEKATQLGLFEATLADIGPHNVAACMKWGLRHLHFGTAGFAKDEDKSRWHFYTSFSEKEVEHDLSRAAYTDLFLPTIPKANAALLKALFDLFAVLSMHAEETAMTGPHLCRLFGFWTFGSHGEEYNSFQQLYEAYKMSSSVLYHLFLAYLRSQGDLLPLRVRNLYSIYPPRTTTLEVEHTIPISEWQILHAVIQLHKTVSFTKPSAKPRAKRFPTALLEMGLSAAEPSDEDSAERAAWISAAESSKDGDSFRLDRLISDETSRIFVTFQEPDMPHSPRSDHFCSTHSISRRRSASWDPERRNLPEKTTTASVIHRKPNQASTSVVDVRHVPAASASTAEDVEEPRSWSQFATTGFGGTADSDNFSLINEFGQMSGSKAQSALRSSRSPAKLKKPRSSRRRRRHSSASSEGLNETASPDEREEDLHPPKADLISVTATLLDPVFADAYLDSLDEPDLTSKWPMFVVAEIKGSIPPYRGIIVEETRSDLLASLSRNASKQSELALPREPASPTQSSVRVESTKSGRGKPSFASLRTRHRISGMLTRLKSGSSVNLPKHGIERVSMPHTSQTRVLQEAEMVPEVADATKRETSPPTLTTPVRRPIPMIIKTSPLTPPRYSMRLQPVISPMKVEEENLPSPLSSKTQDELSERARLADEPVILAATHVPPPSPNEHASAVEADSVTTPLPEDAVDIETLAKSEETQSPPHINKKSDDAVSTGPSQIETNQKKAAVPVHSGNDQPMVENETESATGVNDYIVNNGTEPLKDTPLVQEYPSAFNKPTGSAAVASFDDAAEHLGSIGIQNLVVKGNADEVNTEHEVPIALNTNLIPSAFASALYLSESRGERHIAPHAEVEEVPPAGPSTTVLPSDQVSEREHTHDQVSLVAPVKSSHATTTGTPAASSQSRAGSAIVDQADTESVETRIAESSNDAVQPDQSQHTSDELQAAAGSASSDINLVEQTLGETNGGRSSEAAQMQPVDNGILGRRVKTAEGRDHTHLLITADEEATQHAATSSEHVNPVRGPLRNNSEIQQVTETPYKWTQLNRVSPALKARLTSSTDSLTPVVAPTSKSPSQPVSPSTASPPASPSKAGRLLSGAKKMLSRKKSTIPASAVPAVASTATSETIPGLPAGASDTVTANVASIPTVYMKEPTITPFDRPADKSAESHHAEELVRVANVKETAPSTDSARQIKAESDLLLGGTLLAAEDTSQSADSDHTVTSGVFTEEFDLPVPKDSAGIAEPGRRSLEAEQGNRAIELEQLAREQTTGDNEEREALFSESDQSGEGSSLPNSTNIDHVNTDSSRQGDMLFSANILAPPPQTQTLDRKDHKILPEQLNDSPNGAERTAPLGSSDRAEAADEVNKLATGSNLDESTTVANTPSWFETPDLAAAGMSGGFRFGADAYMPAKVALPKNEEALTVKNEADKILLVDETAAIPAVPTAGVTFHSGSDRHEVNGLLSQEAHAVDQIDNEPPSSYVTQGSALPPASVNALHLDERSDLDTASDNGSENLESVNQAENSIPEANIAVQTPWEFETPDLAAAGMSGVFFPEFDSPSKARDAAPSSPARASAAVIAKLASAATSLTGSTVTGVQTLIGHVGEPRAGEADLEAAEAEDKSRP